MQKFLYYFLVFIIYSILGWIIETCFCSFKQRKLVNRGFLIGPYCPIYGLGAIIIILTLSKYSNNPFILLGMSFLICSFLEYFASWLMEKIFNARWWDYSNAKMNLEGRVCLKNSILFGIGGTLTILVFQPTIEYLLSYLSIAMIEFSSIFLLIIFIIDNICSFVIIKKMRFVVTKIRSDISDENLIIEAAKKAQADNFIRNLKNGYDTLISDNSGLSIGEMQLICIARAILKNPNFVILDEATSNIDALTEDKVTKAFDKLLKHKTSIVIAHRLPTIKNSDLIIVLDSGKIIESGNHEQLIKNKGYYYQLYNSQYE